LDYREFKESFHSIKSGWVLLSLSGVIIVLALKSFRWHLLLKQEGINFSYWNSVKSYFSSYAIGIVTPGRLGEFIKIYNVRQITETDILTSFRSTLVDRLFDLSILFLFAVSGTLRFLSNNSVGHLTGLILSLALTISLILLIRISLGKLFDFKKNGIKRIQRFIKKCLFQLTDYKSIRLWIISFTAYFFFFLTTWFLLKSLSLKISIIDAGYVLSIVGLILLLPISIAGFGTREISLVYLLSLYGISAEPVITFSIMHFLVFFGWGGFLGLIFWILNPIPFEAIKSDSKKILSIIKGTEI
jgi:uncharacterized protein (TIRG00374 family)